MRKSIVKSDTIDCNENFVHGGFAGKRPRFSFRIDKLVDMQEKILWLILLSLFPYTSRWNSKGVWPDGIPG